MGVPAEDFAQLKQWCGYRAALAWGRPAPEDQVEIATSMAAYRKYLRDLVDAKVREPADDLASDLIAIHREAPERLTLDEIGSILFSLSFAGHETTTGLIGNTMRRLLEDPARWAGIVAHPDLIPGPSTRRSATTRRCRSGAGSPPARPRWPAWTCPQGARLFLWLAAATTNEEAFDRPAEFDMSRTDAGQHLAFGKGLHYCLGANLGKLEAQIAVTELARRFPALRLVPDQRLTFHPNISFRGPQVLMVRTGRSASGSFRALGKEPVHQNNPQTHPQNRTFPLIRGARS